MTAMIRNLNKLTMVGVLNNDASEHTRTCCERLRSSLRHYSPSHSPPLSSRSAEAIRAARIHPLNVLLAEKTYSAGKVFLALWRIFDQVVQGDKGSLVWAPVFDVCAALEDCFYASFANVEPTNQRLCLALDVSGSPPPLYHVPVLYEICFELQLVKIVRMLRGVCRVLSASRVDDDSRQRVVCAQCQRGCRCHGYG